MAVVSLDAFVSLPRGARLVGVDLGTKTIGLALSDVERRVATPFDTIRRMKFSTDSARLKSIIEEHAVAGLVVGLPLNMDGTEGPRVQATRAFVRNLAPILSLPVVLWDERLTTAAVTRMLIEADTSRARRSALVDKMAAAYMLQGALDRLADIRSQGSEVRSQRQAPDS